MASAPLKIAVLLSGSGSTLQNFIDIRNQDLLDIDIRVVVSSRPEAGGLQRAEKGGIPTVVVPRRSTLFSKRITETVEQSGVDLVCMAGFLSMWVIPPAFEHRVMNVHPALLPSFGGLGYYGLRVHQAVLEAGCKVSGCTVHFADNHYDHGPIILQRALAVNENDTPETLARRVARLERRVYPEALRLFAAGRLRVEGRCVRVAEASKPRSH